VEARFYSVRVFLIAAASQQSLCSEPVPAASKGDFRSRMSPVAADCGACWVVCCGISRPSFGFSGRVVVVYRSKRCAHEMCLDVDRNRIAAGPWLRSMLVAIPGATTV